MRSLLWAALLAATVAYAAYLVSQNPGASDLDLLFVRLQAPVWSIALGAFGIGAALAGLVCAFPLLRLRLLARRQRRQIARLEQEVHGLRTLPLSPDERSATGAEPG